MKFSHQKTLPVPVNSADAIYETACCLFDELWNHSPSVYWVSALQS
ncbi:MAG: hypothetical protein ACI4V0_02570 [Lachnospiraceae bacterium]